MSKPSQAWLRTRAGCWRATDPRSSGESHESTNHEWEHPESPLASNADYLQSHAETYKLQGSQRSSDGSFVRDF